MLHIIGAILIIDHALESGLLTQYPKLMEHASSYICCKYNTDMHDRLYTIFHFKLNEITFTFNRNRQSGTISQAERVALYLPDYWYGKL